MDGTRTYAGMNDSEGSRICFGSILVDEGGTNGEVYRHERLPTAYIRECGSSKAVPLRGELKKKWMVVAG